MLSHDVVPVTDYIEYSSEEMLARSHALYDDIKRRHCISDRPVPHSIIENGIKVDETAPNGAIH